MKLLSLKELEMFDYVKTRERVEEYIGDLNMIKFKYRNVLPPSLALKLFDIKVQSSGNLKSPFEAYIEKKDEYEREYAEKLNELRHIIMKNADRNPPKAMITNSHVCIFDFIMDEYKSGEYKRLNLVNIDMHHDMFNENETVDCGNWVSHIVKEIPKTRIRWISNPGGWC